MTLAPLEELFTLELEFQRRMRQVAWSTEDGAAVHTSFALQSGYELLLRSVGRVTIGDVERLAARYSPAGDVRDVLRARDSLTALLGLRPYPE
jgi:hypothetical protein